MLRKTIRQSLLQIRTQVSPIYDEQGSQLYPSAFIMSSRRSISGLHAGSMAECTADMQCPQWREDDVDGVAVIAYTGLGGCCCYCSDVLYMRLQRSSEVREKGLKW